MATGSFLGKIFGAGASLGSGIVSSGWNVGKSIWNRPGYFFGAAAIGAGAYTAYSTIQPMVEGAQQAQGMLGLQASYNQSALQYEEMAQNSIMPSPFSMVGNSARYSELMNSTHGLVQGLHRNRHG